MKPTPGFQLALFASYSYHGFITDRDGEMLELEADHRRHAEIENAIRDLKYGVGLNHLPSGRFAANGGQKCSAAPGRQRSAGATRSSTPTARADCTWPGPRPTRQAVAALLAIRPQEAVIDPGASVFGLLAGQISRKIKAATEMAGLGAGFSAHSLGVRTAKDLTAAGRSSRSSWLLEDGKSPRCQPGTPTPPDGGSCGRARPGPRAKCFRRWSRRGDRGSDNRSSDRRT